jgi:mannose-1-phosphate guanylyltransferase
MIMAGGSGTRLWPMSRGQQPKQLIPFIHGEADTPPRSLLQIATDRLEGLVPDDRRYICTGERYRADIRAAMPAFDDARILGEPAPRDTVNAVGFAAAIFQKINPDAVFAVLTADHIIRPADRFLAAMDAGFRLVERKPSRLVSFGIKPTFAATGFGYIEDGGELRDESDDYDGLAFRLARFVEKPPLARAQVFLDSGAFSWNAGMFIFNASTFMRMLEAHVPESHAGLTTIAGAWGTDDYQRVLYEVYPTLPKTSVDYAVMEPAATDTSVQLCGVRMDVDWLDVGSWPSYGETLSPDAAGNRVAGTALIHHDSSGNVVVGSGEGHTVALVGCEDLIVVHTKDATLVLPRHRAQDIKALHEQLPAELR